MENEKYRPLFETRAPNRLLYRLFAASVFVGIVCVWIYRVIHIPGPGEHGRIGWIGMLSTELWFGFYWILTQSVRWCPVFRKPFRNRLLKRYGDEFPRVDVFVCTANPETEPPIMVVNTVLSAMAYDYPPEKLSVYLSDDAGSELTLYALMEASDFSKHWLPFCKKFNVEPRSPAAYFSSITPDEQSDVCNGTDFSSIKKMYRDMENRIERVCKLGRVPEDERNKHRGFPEKDSSSSRRNHDAVLKIIIEEEAKDNEGNSLPILVYMAREKRPQHFHNFKAGALNGLIRVSSEISNAPIILTLDCDMYSNDPNSIKDALCFFVDEEQGHNIAYVQFPQSFENITKNELYGGSFRVLQDVNGPGLDGQGGSLYVGTGCFHRREAIYGSEYKKEAKVELKSEPSRRKHENVHEFEERLKELISCTYEDNSQWGHEIGLKYGIVVEDIVTGIAILCKGWRSVYFSPKRRAFLGFATTTLDQTLVQQKRWSEGHLSILLSKYNPAWNGIGKLKVGYIMACFISHLWSLNCFAVLWYSIVPPLYLLKGFKLFPKVSSIWFLPFAYSVVSESAYNCAEFLWVDGTLLGWWNEQRMWLYKRTTSYLFAFLDTVLKLIGYYQTSTFVVSTKVSDDEDARLRYEQEVMEFGCDSPMFTILSSVAMINMLCFVWGIKRMVTERFVFLESLGWQIVLCGVLVLINLPLYNGMFLRRDKGSMPKAVTLRSIVVSLSVCTCFLFL